MFDKSQACVETVSTRVPIISYISNLTVYWSSSGAVNQMLLFELTPPPAEILEVLSSTVSPLESSILISISKSSKNAFEKTSKLTCNVSSLLSPSLSDKTELLMVKLAGAVILAASTSTVP